MEMNSPTDLVNIQVCDPGQIKTIISSVSPHITDLFTLPNSGILCRHLLTVFHRYISTSFCAGIRPLCLRSLLGQYFGSMLFFRRFGYVLPRYLINLCCWFMLGFGSAAFHGTQTTWGEFVDEVFMVLSIASTSYCLHDIHPLTTGRRGMFFYGIFTAFVTSFSLVYMHVMYHPFFALCFLTTSLIVIALIETLPIVANSRPIKAYAEHSKEEIIPEPEVKGLVLKRYPFYFTLRLGVGTALAGYAIWHIDQACVRQKWEPPSHLIYELNLYLWAHSVWHVLTAVGIFFLIQATILARVKTARSGLIRRPGTGSFIPISPENKLALMVSLGTTVATKKLA